MNEVEPYGIIEQEILFMKGLSQRAKLVYSALKTYVNEGVLAFPKQEVLADGLGISNRTVKLESSGSGQYIVPEHLKGPMISYIIEKSLLGRLGVPNVGVETDTTKYAEVT
ncbi:MAG: helix-turn-helix domain-containing protein, partial [Candidatus Hermodarchaeota archaeon]